MRQTSRAALLLGEVCGIACGARAESRKGGETKKTHKNCPTVVLEVPQLSALSSGAGAGARLSSGVADQSRTRVAAEQWLEFCDRAVGTRMPGSRHSVVGGFKW
ncbi:hypothetical protein B0T21DRAFT_368181 [Apiosordaria backusii]|uniref:Uncharacterized protein n=1 Tax=Apiosordaria backusii TaxID=314023 RepID=A0AA40EBQ4_9PEZI|nr:hypothetical protein B0T21DRAFT_368181 [Apiosordaria backusii]